MLFAHFEEKSPRWQQLSKAVTARGFNGWTGEPKDKYYELKGWTKD